MCPVCPVFDSWLHRTCQPVLTEQFPPPHPMGWGLGEPFFLISVLCNEVLCSPTKEGFGMVTRISFPSCPFLTEHRDKALQSQIKVQVCVFQACTTQVSNKGTGKRNYHVTGQCPLLVFCNPAWFTGTHRGELLFAGRSVRSNRLLNMCSHKYLHILSCWKKLCLLTEDFFSSYCTCGTVAHENYQCSQITY